jgi:Xaa-Pro aminopeptidase
MARLQVTRLRAEMENYGIDAYLIPTDDFHASEYVGDYFKCREYISGFDGSAGTLVVTTKEAGLWTDGRYFLQAQEQLEGSGIKLYRLGEKDVPTILQYLKNTLKREQCLGYDGRTISTAYAKALKEQLNDKKIKFEESLDLAGMIWEERPPMSAEPIWLLEDSFAGKTRKEKLQELREEMKNAGTDVFLLASLDDIAWLYNIRGNDILYNPVALAYTMVWKEQAVLYCNPKVLSDSVKEALKQDGIDVQPYLSVYLDLRNLDKRIKILLDENATNVALRSALPSGVLVINHKNPTTLAKAVKNRVEMQHVCEAHIKDGVAVTKMIYWIKTNYGKRTITELDVCEKLEEFRKEGSDYLGQSFAPIAAAGPHGAIVHYEPVEETNIPLVDNSFLLLDTGGQYLQGTTDITRTIVCGAVDERMREHYTAVLRGNLNLAAVHFKYGCTGANFDYLARSPLWELGLDYNHGTGHGVGYLLNVHEGPNAFRLKDVNNSVGAAFEEGMITSDEPGLYLEGEYGIRLENLLLCKKKKKTDYGQFMEFETLTLVPFDRTAIFSEKMTQHEKELLNQYHKRVYDTIAPFLTTEEAAWLQEETAEI